MKALAELTVYAASSFFQIEGPSITRGEVFAYAEGVSFASQSDLFRLRLMLAESRAVNDAAAVFERFRGMVATERSDNRSAIEQYRFRQVRANAASVLDADSTLVRIRAILAAALTRTTAVTTSIRARSIFTQSSRGVSTGAAASVLCITTWRSAATWETPGLTWQG